MGLFRRRSSEPDDPVARLDRAKVPRRLDPIVADAIRANTRWRELVSSLEDGPLVARLNEIGERVERGVIDVHGTAVRVGEVERVLATLDPDRAVTEFKRLKRAVDAGAAPPEFDAVRQRFESTQRLLNVVADAEERLRILDARLGAAVARGAEIALTAGGAEFSALDDDLDSVLDELTALRAGLDAVN
jgi:hypothetical protein